MMSKPRTILVNFKYLTSALTPKMVEDLWL